jgi:hypothetical protein
MYGDPARLMKTTHQGQWVAKNNELRRGLGQFVGQIHHVRVGLVILGTDLSGVLINLIC